jgi:enoyl-CoA hydratase/carnithine racemase
LGRATELLMLGDRIKAQRAYEIGLATEVVPDEELAEQAAALAQRLADGPALAYSATKVALTRELDSDLASSIEIEALTQALLMKSEDFTEFYTAWHEGRKPDWRGR